MSLNSLHTKVGSGTEVAGSGESDLNVQCVAMYTYDFPVWNISLWNIQHASEVYCRTELSGVISASVSLGRVQLEVVSSRSSLSRLPSFGIVGPEESSTSHNDLQLI